MTPEDAADIQALTGWTPEKIAAKDCQDVWDALVLALAALRACRKRVKTEIGS